MAVCDTVGPRSGNIARTSWLAAGLPDEVPESRSIVNAGSSRHDLLHFAAQAVMSGTSDLVIAGGTQSMSMIPITLAVTAGNSAWISASLRVRRNAGRIGEEPVSQFDAAELIQALESRVSGWNAFALESQRRALRAQARAASTRDGQLFVDCQRMSAHEEIYHREARGHDDAEGQ